MHRYLGLFRQVLGRGVDRRGFELRSVDVGVGLFVELGEGGVVVVEVLGVARDAVVAGAGGVVGQPELVSVRW